MSIRVFLGEDQKIDGLYDIMVEEERDRATQEVDSIELSNKKKTSKKKKEN